MEHRDYTFAGAGGTVLYGQCWLPQTPARAVVALVHGVLEHSDRYLTLAEALPAQGFALCAFDLRGHGRSSGPRVHVAEWGQYREDLARFLDEVGERVPGVPRFLYGHSLGSLITLDFLLARPRAVTGAVISGAALEPAGVASPLLIGVARVLARVAPAVRLPLNNQPEHFTRDPEMVRRAEADPMIQRAATARWGIETLAAVARIKEEIDRLETPLLIVHGEADPLNLVAGSRWLYEQAPPGSVLRVYPGGLHEPHNDLQRAQVMADVAAWLEQQLGEG